MTFVSEHDDVRVRAAGRSASRMDSSVSSTPRIWVFGWLAPQPSADVAVDPVDA